MPSGTWTAQDRRWRRKTFSDFTGALRHAAPSNTQFDPATRAANLVAQIAAARQSQVPHPGATQHLPRQSS